MFHLMSLGSVFPFFSYSYTFRGVSRRLDWRRLEIFNFFGSFGGGGSEIPSLRRRRLENFKIFVRYGGGGCIFFPKIGGGSAARLTPLYTFITLTTGTLRRI
jgi:hypothetical protein